MKIRPVGAELFHADVQTDGHTERHDEANIRFFFFFFNFSNALKRAVATRARFVIVVRMTVITKLISTVKR